MTIKAWFLRVTSGFWTLLAFQKDQERQGDSRGGSGLGGPVGNQEPHPDTSNSNWNHSQAMEAPGATAKPSWASRKPAAPKALLYYPSKRTFPQALGTTMNWNFSAKHVLSQVSAIPATKNKP